MKFAIAFVEDLRGYYCSSSPASENAEVAFPTDAPHTTLVAEAFPRLDPQTTLNALRRLLFQGRELPQTTELPLAAEEPQTTEVPQTTLGHQTTELAAT